jgi:predicted esterase
MHSPKAHTITRLIIFFLPVFQLNFSALAGDDALGNEVQIEMTLPQLVGHEQAEHYADIIDSDEVISWQLYIPANASSEPPGLLVYVSPTRSGRIHPRWRAVLDEQNLIYISADHSGNRIPTMRRMVLALMAVRAAATQYAFDVDRMMVSGFSGGGRVASILSTQYPEVFTGALYICGVDFWNKRRAPKVDKLIKNRFVFLTGSRDFNRDEVRNIHGRYVKAGAINSELLVIPGMTHELPDQKVLSQALDYLSARSTSAAD